LVRAHGGVASFLEKMANVGNAGNVANAVVRSVARIRSYLGRGDSISTMRTS
jgi:hypothetical protein